MLEKLIGKYVMIRYSDSIGVSTGLSVRMSTGTCIIGEVIDVEDDKIMVRFYDQEQEQGSHLFSKATRNTNNGEHYVIINWNYIHSIEIINN